ncbi:MAG: D-sedoheptulose 7-phosphate isomerase [Prevotellaceae bacterium]|jgi:D-sedoheptulose 7-phosphate isomerase|nr:D-sedoheptulose 7-phosphate isomerase [Prevotellaceae bacterium]
MNISNALQASIAVKQQILQDAGFLQKIEEAITIIVAALRRGNKILFCGNGGSAADAQHLAAEFSGRFYFDRAPLPAEALHCNTSYITAVGNDYGFDEVYARILRGSGNAGDVLVGLSTSGNSENILRAFAAAREKGITTVAFTGESGGKMKDAADILLNVPSSDTPRIQEAHITIGHIVCEEMEKRMFPEGK